MMLSFCPIQSRDGQTDGQRPIEHAFSILRSAEQKINVDYRLQEIRKPTLFKPTLSAAACYWQAVFNNLHVGLYYPVLRRSSTFTAVTNNRK
jgi:hypothetical protein